jgi:cytochrome b561
MSQSRIERYTPVAQALHWVTAVLMLAAVILAWVFMSEPDQAADRFTNITLHKSLGQTIFFLAVFRLVWRRFHPPPPLAGRIARWEAVMARCSHWLLYAIMLVMPISGYILATAAARPSPYFWLFYWPQPPLIPAVAHAALRVHLACQYAVYTFVGLHVLAVVWHVAVRRDEILGRMVPPPRDGTPPEPLQGSGRRSMTVARGR